MPLIRCRSEFQIRPQMSLLEGARSPALPGPEVAGQVGAGPSLWREEGEGLLYPNLQWHLERSWHEGPSTWHKCFANAHFCFPHFLPPSPRDQAGPPGQRWRSLQNMFLLS